MSTANLKEMVSSRLSKATDRIKEDLNSLIEFEKQLKTPNLSTLQLQKIEDSLFNIESRLQNFSYKGISQGNKDFFTSELKQEFYQYINERNILQSKLLSLQNRIDTRLLIHKRREKDKNKILSEELSEIQLKLNSILKDIKNFETSSDLPFSQILEHYKLINRNLNRILTDLSQDSFNLFKEGADYKNTLNALKVVKDEFSKLKSSLANKSIPVSDLVRLIESLKLTYIDKIPLLEIYESFQPVKKEEIEKGLIEVIQNPLYFPHFNLSLDTKNKSDSYLIFSPKDVKSEEKIEDIREEDELVSEMSSERRYEIFKRVLKKFESIKISQLAGLLGMKSDKDVLEYLLDIPDEFGFKIQNDTLLIEQRDEVLERIDTLVSMFETDSTYGKESKI